MSRGTIRFSSVIRFSGVRDNILSFFYSHTVHLDTIRVFICQLMHKRVALKEY